MPPTFSFPTPQPSTFPPSPPSAYPNPASTLLHFPHNPPAHLQNRFRDAFGIYRGNLPARWDEYINHEEAKGMRRASSDGG